MSTPENLVVTVPIETGNGNATIDCDVSQVRDFRVSFMPARRFTFGDEGQYGSDIPVPMSDLLFKNPEFDLPVQVDGDSFRVYGSALAGYLGFHGAAEMVRHLDDDEKVLVTTPVLRRTGTVDADSGAGDTASVRGGRSWSDPKSDQDRTSSK